VLDAVHHPRLGLVRERVKMMPTAEHTGSAFVLGAGPGFRRGHAGENSGLADLAPTVLHLAGAPAPEDMEGRVLQDLLDPAHPAARPQGRRAYDWAQNPWEVRA
jgi:predicted AlkP superfamily phosphohydrolase/phosphomutase